MRLVCRSMCRWACVRLSLGHLQSTSWRDICFLGIRTVPDQTSAAPTSLPHSPAVPNELFCKSCSEKIFRRTSSHFLICQTLQRSSLAQNNSHSNQEMQTSLLNTLFLQRPDRLQVKAAKYPNPNWTCQTQAGPKQPGARCPLFVQSPSARAPDAGKNSARIVMLI